MHQIHTQNLYKLLYSTLGVCFAYIIFLFAQWGISSQLFCHEWTCSPTPTCIMMCRVGFVQTGCRRWVYALPHIFTSYCVLKTNIFHNNMSSVYRGHEWMLGQWLYRSSHGIGIWLVSWHWLQSTVYSAGHWLHKAPGRHLEQRKQWGTETTRISQMIN